jgi:hypothetical protein
MSVAPLDLQRRFEQRWAARFLQPTPNTPRRQFERQELATRRASEPQRGERGTEAPRPTPGSPLQSLGSSLVSPDFQTEARLFCQKARC